MLLAIEGRGPGQPNIADVGRIIMSPQLANPTYDEQYKKILDGPCPLHRITKHMMKDYYGLAKEFKNKKQDDCDDDQDQGHRPPEDDGAAFKNYDKVVATIFGGIAATESGRDWKLTAHRVLFES